MITVFTLDDCILKFIEITSYTILTIIILENEPEFFYYYNVYLYKFERMNQI